MVMETPSPQCVGLEFVRQYYTVLNKAPMHLHRFYSHNSLFMHGGPNSVNEPTVGQADIHKKILSLNFQDCHAKIRMVDAHATLGNGVVIQVTGELSNSGLPMRRFMQTFVLAPQSPKKYYVHNDIFRYQDEVFSDDEPTDDGASEPEEELDPVEGPNFSNSTATVNGTSHHHSNLRERDSSPVMTQSAPTHIQSPAQVGSCASPVRPSPIKVTPPSAAPVQIPASPPTAKATPAPIVSEPRPPTPPNENDGWVTPGGPPSDTEWVDPIEEPVSPPKKEPTPVKSVPLDPVPSSAPHPTPPQSIEPKTYANLFKNSSSSSNFTQNSITSTVVQPTNTTQESSSGTQQSYAAQSQPRSESVNSRPSVAPSNTTGPAGGAPPSAQSSNTRLSRNFNDEERRRPAVPDTQQVFVGNLPHTIGEDQLRAEFTQYGKILDIRINTGKGKAGAKGPGGHQVPNFGFIAFEDEDSVSRCLSARPIYLNGDNRINVEEKKARSRMDGGMGGPGRPTNSRGGMGGSGMRGGNSGRGGGRGGFNRDGGSFSRDNSRGGSSASSRGGGGGGGYMQRR